MRDETSLDIVKTVFEHRLKESDMDRILTALSKTDREDLIAKIGDLLSRISSLVEVYNQVSDSLSLDVILPRLMGIITEALRADRSTLFLNDPDANELYSRVAQGDSIGEIRFPNHMGIAGSVFTSGEDVIIPDAYKDPRFNPAIDKKTGYRTRNILCAAIKNKGRIIGVTQVLNKQNGDFRPEDLALLEALTARAASALENAQLYEKVQKARREEARLLDVTSAIAAELNLDVLLQKIISAATDMLGADRSTLFVYDSKTEELWSRVAQGLEAKEIRFPASAGIAGSCFTSAQTVNIPDAYADSRFNQEVDKKTGYRTRSILCMPVMNKKGRGLGVLQALNKKGGPFDKNDESRLRAFTAQVAIALENAQLFQEVKKERNYNESVLRSLSNGVVTLDAQGAVAKVNEAALKILAWRLDDVLGRPLKEIFAQEENSWIHESLAKVSKSGEIDQTLDAEIHFELGKPISVNLSAVPLVDTEGDPIGSMLILEDITKEKRIKGTMARYLTKEVADKLLEGGEETLGGNAQVATVLFSDIRSFTTISEQLGARDTVLMLNDYFTDMVEVIFNHKGILDKFIGDAIMAIFGAPFQHELDADNAVAAACAMASTLRQKNLQREMLGIPPIKIGVGLSTGELVAGNIGSPKRMDYTVIGDTVNLASRLEGVTKFFGVQVLMSEFTVGKLTRPAKHREIDLLRVKGKTKPVAVYEALGHHDEDSFPGLDSCLASFSQGLELYRQRDFKRALECFQETVSSHPEDGPSKHYLGRCRHYLERPPAPDWDGVFVMETK